MTAGAQTIARAQDGTVVTHDGALLGFIIDRRHGCDAIARDGRTLGRFNSTHAAVRALLHDLRECEGDTA